MTYDCPFNNLILIKYKYWINVRIIIRWLAGNPKNKDTSNVRDKILLGDNFMFARITKLFSTFHSTPPLQSSMIRYYSSMESKSMESNFQRNPKKGEHHKGHTSIAHEIIISVWSITSFAVCPTTYKWFDYSKRERRKDEKEKIGHFLFSAVGPRSSHSLICHQPLFQPHCYPDNRKETGFLFYFSIFCFIY